MNRTGHLGGPRFPDRVTDVTVVWIGPRAGAAREIVMRIVVFGTGGAGGYFGAQLALAGQDVVFVARGEHLKAIQANGLRLETPAGQQTIRATATDDPAQLSNIDIVLLGVKAWQVTDAAAAIKPAMGAETVVVPLQNGVEAPSQLAAVL